MLVIGELINATRRLVRQAVLEHHEAVMHDLAVRQSQAGADYLDVNVAAGTGDSAREAADMQWAVETIRQVCDMPLAIDTADPRVLAAGLQAAGPGTMVNSVSLESGRLEPFLELIREYDASAVALPVSDAGVPKEPRERLANCQHLLEKALEAGVPGAKLYFDPLVMPLSVDTANGPAVLETLRGLREGGMQTTLGLSNISYGLPQRSLLNRSLLAMALAVGLDSVILNPLDRGVAATLIACRALHNEDPMCGRYLRAYRKGELE